MAYVCYHLNDSVSLDESSRGANTIVIRNCIPDAPSGGGITPHKYVCGRCFPPGCYPELKAIMELPEWFTNNISTTRMAVGTPCTFYNEDRTFIAGTPIRAERHHVSEGSRKYSDVLT